MRVERLTKKLTNHHLSSVTVRNAWISIYPPHIFMLCTGTSTSFFTMHMCKAICSQWL
jgi:hypothetical protein